jgi:flagellar hook assembly protein FlgD
MRFQAGVLRRLPQSGDTYAFGRSVVAYPVSGQAVMSFSLEKAGYVVVRVYDLLGRLVRTFAEDHPSGTYGIMWDGRLANGRRAPRGIYFYRMTLPNGKETFRKTQILH